MPRRCRQGRSRSRERAPGESCRRRSRIARRSSRASLSGWDGAAHVPGPRRQAEWTGRRPEPLGRAALEALAPRVVECPVEAAEIADAVRERVPEVIEVGVVGAGVDLAERDLLKPSGAPELLELMRARERVALVGPERTCKLRVDVEFGVAPGELLPEPDPHIGARCALAARRDEALGRVDRGHVPSPENLRQLDRQRTGPAAHVQRPLTRPDAGHPDHLPCELGTVTADMPVVGVYCGAGNGGAQLLSHAPVDPTFIRPTTESRECSRPPLLSVA